MKINAAGLDLIKRFEGCKLTAYPDPGTGGEPWTIGRGHTGGVVEGMKITEQQALDMLANDCITAEDGVANNVKVALTNNQFSALVSFTFNCGTGALAKSRLLKLLNSGDYDGAAAEFDKWNKGGGKVLTGLVKRRAAERQLFRTPDCLGCSNGKDA